MPERRQRVRQSSLATCGPIGNRPMPAKARYNRGSIQQAYRRILLAEDKLYKAEYLGSGTFVISKPKRKKIKMRQSQLKNPQRGSRK